MGTPHRGTYASGGESYSGIRPLATYGSSSRNPGEPRVPYSDAALFIGGSRDGERGRRLEEELLLALALYGFGGSNLHSYQKPEGEEDNLKPRKYRPYDACMQQDVSASYRSEASVSTRAKEGGLEKKAKDRKDKNFSHTATSLSYQL